MPGTRQTTDRSRKSRPRGSPELLLELIIEEFIFDTQQKTSDGSTPRAYRQPLRLFTRFLTEELGRPPWLSDFTLAAVQRRATTLQERPKWERGGLAVGTRPLAVETRRTYLRTLRTFSNWLPRPPHAYCAEAPLKHLILPRASQTHKLPLTDDEITRLIWAAKEDTVFGARDTAMLLFLMDSATRAMELCHLRIGDVTLQTGLVLVARGKGNKTRAVTVGDETRLALRRYAVMRDRRDPGPLARGWQGGRQGMSVRLVVRHQHIGPERVEAGVPAGHTHTTARRSEYPPRIASCRWTTGPKRAGTHAPPHSGQGASRGGMAGIGEGESAMKYLLEIEQGQPYGAAQLF
jgi:integrase